MWCSSAVISGARPDLAESVRAWVGPVGEHTQPTCQIFIVATKADLIGRDQMGKCFAYRASPQQELGLVGLFMTSAKTGEGIADVFFAAAKYHSWFGPAHSETPVHQIELREADATKCR